MDWLRRLARRLTWKPPIWVTEYDVRRWKEVNPGRCMYCSYTHWANTEQEQSLKLDPHNCVEGNSPPAPLPIARIRRAR